jgi:hypothetical protein
VNTKKQLTGFESLVYNVYCILTLGAAYTIKVLIQKAIMDSKTEEK